MPRHVIRPAVRTPRDDQLVKRLATELKTPSEDPLPLVLEEEVPATGTRHVVAIWDRWKSIDHENRSRIITEAYAEAEGASFAETIVIATGVTPAEALALGLLPYKVEPSVKRHSGEDIPARRTAMANEARHTVLGAKAKELRYARLEDAEAALARLKAAYPAGKWVVIEEREVERD